MTAERDFVKYFNICVLLLVACDDALVLVDVPPCGPPQCMPEECGGPCVLTDEGPVFGQEAVFKTCHLGVTECDNQGNMECSGSAMPTEEVCDPFNFDEDCSGEGNDIIYEWWEAENTCDLIGECLTTPMVCDSLGNLFCVPESNTCGTEVCDGLDNDGDGLVDSDDDDLTYEGESFQYQGPEATLNVGECRAGRLKCEHGQEYLFGQVLPTAEICGNGDDDDCDGLEDEDEGDQGVQAFLIVLDLSGSMYGTIFAVNEALCGWAQSGAFSNSRFAIQGVASVYTGGEPYIETIIDFSTAEDACQTLETYLILNGLGGGSEFVPYAIWASNNLEGFMLEWPDNMTRRVVFFTDEQPQGYQQTYEEDIDWVVTDCSAQNYTVGGFISNYYPQWHTMTDACGGWIDHLSEDPTEMQEDLQRRFGSEC